MSEPVDGDPGAPSGDPPARGDSPATGDGQPAVDERTRPVELPSVRVEAPRERRQRLLFQSVVVTFMMISTWIAVLVGLQFMSGTSHNFRPEIERVLERIRNNQAEQVYEEASPELQRTMILERFLYNATQLKQTLGEFREILASKSADFIDGPHGKTARVRVTLQFEFAKVNGHFSFHEVNGQWRLLGFSINLPAELVPEITSDEALYAATEAPTEVIQIVREILARSTPEQDAQTYEASASLFQRARTREDFLALQAERREKLGDFVRVLEIYKSYRNQSNSKASVVAVVEYAKGEGASRVSTKTNASVDFVKEDGVWRLRRYKVVIPPPRIPKLNPEPKP